MTKLAEEKKRLIIVITTITILIRADVQAISFTDGKHDKKESRRQEGTTSSTGLLNSSIIMVTPSILVLVFTTIVICRPQVCDDKSLEKAGPLIVVNLMKIKDPEALAK